MRKIKGISIQNTTKCNARCKVCPHSIVYKDKYDMSDEVWDRVLFSLKEMDFNGYVAFLLQCEPLMDKKLPDRIRDLKKMNPGMQVWMFTNASLLTLDLVKELRDLKVDNITMSLLSAEKTEYQELTGLPFDLVLNNIIKAIIILERTNTYTEINASLGSPAEKENYRKILPHFINKIKFNIRDSRAGFFDNLKSDYENWCLKCVNDSQLFCSQPDNTLPVMADGSVRFCSVDWTGESYIGNLKENTISGLFYSDKMELSIKKLKGRVFDYECCEKCFSEIGLGKCGY